VNRLTIFFDLLRFLFLAMLRIMARCFCRFHVEHVRSGAVDSSAAAATDANSWEIIKSNGGARNVRLVVILNHTSLFEPVYCGVLPWSIVWRIASGAVFPAADITWNRPIVGRIMQLMAPGVIPVSRERDATWDNFVTVASGKGHLHRPLVMILPEGRMKRPNGLDKHGKAMTIRGGVADVLAEMDDGLMLVTYSGGLHQLHVPGQGRPNLFSHLAVGFEVVPIAAYRDELRQRSAQISSGAVKGDPFKIAVIQDLEARRDRHCPRLEALCHSAKKGSAPGAEF